MNNLKMLDMNKTDLGQLPYESGWIDRLFGGLDRLPGPAWLCYTLCALSLVLLVECSGSIGVAPKRMAILPASTRRLTYPFGHVTVVQRRYAIHNDPVGAHRMQPSRDERIKRISARKRHKAYGMGLGIMLLDDVYPGFPGDVRNASGYPFPIQYEIVEGVDIQRLVYSDDKASCLEPLKRAAQKLEDLGCRAIAAECGYFAYFQREVAASVDVPSSCPACFRSH